MQVLVWYLIHTHVCGEAPPISAEGILHLVELVQLTALFLLPKTKIWNFPTYPAVTSCAISLGEVFAICGSSDALGNWNPQNAVALLPENETGER